MTVTVLKTSILRLKRKSYINSPRIYIYMLTSLIQDKKKENLWQLSILSKPDFYFPVRGSPWKGDKNVGQWTFLSGLLQQTGDGLWSRKDDDNLVPRPQGNNTEVWECQAEQEQWTSAGAVRLFFSIIWNLLWTPSARDHEASNVNI